VSLEVAAAVNRRQFREAMLFTHRGLSGPAILQISSYWRPGSAITIDLMPGRDARAVLLELKRTRTKAELRTPLGDLLPQRLANSLAPAGDKPLRLADIPDRALVSLAEHLNGWRLTPNGSEGYAKAEVTRGGVDTRHLSSRTMAANEVPGLFVIGEAVDVTGWLGGYNFQWAWASGWCAGQEV
jgi:predicted Rossmann fold flavoprotein